MPNNIIPLPPLGAEEHARAETERRRQIEAWTDRVLRDVGLADRVARANSPEDLRRIIFDPDDADVVFAVRAALHPASGAKADYFEGLREGGLKRILRKGFEEMKAQRLAELLRGQGRRSQPAAPDWTADLKLDKHGGVRPILSNLILFLRYHPKWQGVLSFDEFNTRVVMRKRPPWGEENPDAQWTDHHETQTRTWFQREDIDAKIGDVGRAVQAAARNSPYHPVRDYLDALVWDRRPRLDTWLVTYFHAEDTPYSRAIGPRFLISAVARIYQPGLKVDHTPIFEGPQGRQKTETLRALAVRDEWFTDRLSHLASKDAAIEIAGVWLVEIAEMDALTRASASAMKAFLTRRFDRFRPPWARHLIRLQRQCVFAATINPPIGGYLKDPSGARRLWPVECRGMIDRDGIERDRDQLWAEAVVLFRAGKKWWLETPELEALATAEQAARFKGDPWQDAIKQWIGRRPDVSIGEVLQDALRIEPWDQSHSDEIRVVNILKTLGFKKYFARRGDQRQKRYRRH
jgi:predicted P-loop ATPase